MASEKKKLAKRRKWGRDDTELSLLALPTTIWYLLFCFAPMFGIIIAFKDYKVHGGFIQSFLQSQWVGFKNFEFLFSSKDIWLIIRNTLAYNIVFIMGDGPSAVVHEARYVAPFPGVYEPVEGRGIRHGSLSGDHHRY